MLPPLPIAVYRAFFARHVRALVGDSSRKHIRCPYHIMPLHELVPTKTIPMASRKGGEGTQSSATRSPSPVRFRQRDHRGLLGGAGLDLLDRRVGPSSRFIWWWASSIDRVRPFL